MTSNGTDTFVQQITSLVEIDHMTIWLSNFVLNSYWDSVCS